MKDAEIRLFGRKISLPECGGECSGESSEVTDGVDDGPNFQEISEGNQGENQPQDVKEQATDLSKLMGQDEEENSGPTEDLDDNSKTLSTSTDGDVVSGNDPKTENEQSNATNGQQKTLKKPDKILPCPRCDSIDTKFCYYNNYNANQPRHFCRCCQRYWTAGGTMRNVPVGAGRRKTKNSVSHCRHITISEALHSTRFDTPNEFDHMKCKTNGTVLSFGRDSPLCETMASAFSLADKMPNGSRNGNYKLNRGENRESIDDCPVGSSGKMSNLPVDEEKTMPQQPVMHNINGFPSSGAPCIPGVPWPFPWNSAIAFPAICPPGYPLPYYPAPYWNCGLPNAWNVPWVSVPSPTTNKKGSSEPSSPLGKHSRNGELLKANNSEDKDPMEPKAGESSIVVTKTLRIVDPEEAAKSSIWTTLGIKYDAYSREDLFKAFEPKGDEKKQASANSPLLQANPAALSRSISFQERA